MSKNRNQNILLVEIMIAVLFFALCSVVMLETVVAAREYERRSFIETEALIKMQSIAECVYAADDAELYLENNGFVCADGIWKYDAGEYCLEMTIESEETSVGILRNSVIRALRNDEMIAELPGSRYIPGGEAK